MTTATANRAADYRPASWPVRDGYLSGGVYHPAGRGAPILAVHGITGNHRCWPAVATGLPDRPIIAPDLRGRGRSASLPGPAGMRGHADDCVRALDAEGADRVVVVGHSMGGFVAVRFAERYPDRVASVVLLDGGLPLSPAPGEAPPDPQTALGPAMARLTRSFGSVPEYLEFWRAHPAIGPYWNPVVEQYLRYDLVGEPPELRSAVNPEVIIGDFAELDGRDGYAEALAGLAAPLALVQAPRGLFDSSPGLYADDAVDRFAAVHPSARVERLADVNHYTMIMGHGDDHAAAERIAMIIAAAPIG